MAVNPGNRNLCIVGFGNVRKASVKLLQHKSSELRERHGIESNGRLDILPGLTIVERDADL